MGKQIAHGNDEQIAHGIELHKAMKQIAHGKEWEAYKLHFSSISAVPGLNQSVNSRKAKKRWCLLGH